MQDRYSGDVGDFGKFGLLRHLLNDSEYSLGVNWYLFPNEQHNEDGKFIKYLSSQEYKQCDKELHEKLKSVVANTRCVSALENANLFNCQTTYFSNIVDFYPKYPGQTKVNKEKRLSLRNTWKDLAISTLATNNVLFLDPDNGLEVDSCKSLNQKRSGKFTFFDEINKFHQGKAFTVIYHHLNRHKNHGTHVEQIQNRAQELKDKIDPVHTVFCLRYTPYSPRVFFILATANVMSEIKMKLNNFMGGNWGQYWGSYYECK